MDAAGGQGNVEFKESIGLKLVVKFDQWLEGLEKSEKAINEFGKVVIDATKGLTSTFVKTQTSLEKSASKITGVFRTIRNDLAKTTAIWGTASLAMAQHATTMQRSMFALEKTAMSTGKSFAAQMKLIEDSIGGVASRAELLSSSVSLMSTSLDASQMKQFVEVVKDTSAALGTDFSANIEHAVASLKVMDTRLLANMGIMVSMEELTKKMTLKFPGADPATLSMQQQQAALLDVIIEKTKIFSGANKEMSEKGLFAWAEFKENLKDISIAIGNVFIPAWNSVAKILASVTKSIKNFFENETVQKFGKVVAAVVVPAMVLLLAAFTALTPIVGLVMKLLTVAPFVALTMAVVQFTKVLVGTGSVTQAFTAFGGALKNIGDPISLAWKSFKALKEILPQLTYEMKAMQHTGQSTGKYFTDLGVAVKNVMPKIKEISEKHGVPQEAKNMTMVPFAKETFEKVKVAAAGAIGPVKGLQQQIATFGIAIKSLFTSIQSGIIGGVTNTKRMVTALYELFGKSMIGAIGGFRIAFAALTATIRAGAVAAGMAIKGLLAYVAPLILIGFAIKGVMLAIDKLKDKWVEHKDGSRELRDEVAALRKEYEGLAVAMDKANPKKTQTQTQGYKDIVDFAEREGKSGKELTDDWMKKTGIKEAQSAGGRENIRNLVDQKNAMRELRDGVSSVSVEFKKFSANVTELSNKASDSYTKVKLYSEGLRTEEQAYEGMLSKAATLNVVDMDKYIKNTVEPERMKAVEVELNKARRRFASAPELKVVEENANKMFDAYIKLLKDPKKTQALLDINRNNQLQLRQSMRSDTFNAELTESLKLARGRILELQSKIADGRNSAVKAGLEAMLKIEEDSFAERYAFLERSLTMEYELYKSNRERLVTMFEADQLNKTFFKAASGARTFSVQVNQADKIDISGIKKVDESLKDTTKTTEKFNTAWEAGNAVRNVGIASLYGTIKALDVVGNAGVRAVGAVVDTASNLPSIGIKAMEVIVGGLDAVGDAGVGALGSVVDFIAGLADIKPQAESVKSSIGDILSMEYDLGEAATDTTIKLSEAAIQAATAAAAGGVELKSVADILKEFSSGGVVGGLKIASDTIEEIDAKLKKLSLNKLMFEFATIEIQTAKAIKAAEELKKTWASNPEAYQGKIKEEITKQQELMDSWVARWIQASNQLIDNQKNILNKQRESVQVAAEFTRKMEDASRAIELTNRNMIALKHSIAQQTSPVVDAEQGILELQAQQAQAIGDVVGFAEKRLKLLEKTYDSQEKLADAAKAESEDTRLSMEDRINAAKREQEIRKSMFQVGSELERIDPRKNVRPQAQLDRSLEIGKVLKDYLDKKNMADMAAAELAKKIEEIKKETIIQEGKLNKLKFDMDMIVLAEERAAMKIQQAISKENQRDLHKLLLGLAKLDKSGDSDKLIKDLEDGFAEADARVEEATAVAEADKKKTLDALGITATSSVEQAKLIADQTKEVQALVELQSTANGILGAIRDGLISANEARAKAAEVNISSAHDVAQGRIAEERRVSNAISGVGGGRPPTGTDTNVYPQAKSLEERMKTVSEGIKGVMGSPNVKGMEEVYKNQSEALKAQTQIFQNTIGRGVQFAPPQPLGGYQQFDATNKQAVVTSSADNVGAAWRQQTSEQLNQVASASSTNVVNIYDRQDKLIASERLTTPLGKDSELAADMIRNKYGDVGWSGFPT